MRVWRVANDLDTKLNLWEKLRVLCLVCWHVILTKKMRFPSIWVLLFHRVCIFRISDVNFEKRNFDPRSRSIILVEQLYVQITSNFHRMTPYPILICHINNSCQLRDLSGYLLVLKRLYKLNLIVKFELRRDSYTTAFRTYIFYVKQ